MIILFYFLICYQFSKYPSLFAELKFIIAYFVTRLAAIGALQVHDFISMVDCNFDDIHFKYIDAASKTGQTNEVEHVTWESKLFVFVPDPDIHFKYFTLNVLVGM